LDKSLNDKGMITKGKIKPRKGLFCQNDQLNLHYHTYYIQKKYLETWIMFYICFY